MKSTKDIVEILACVVNESINGKLNYEKANTLLRSAKHTIQVFALLLDSAKLKGKAKNQKLSHLNMD